MKLKVILNDQQSPDDYKLLRTAVSTVASLRDSAVLRFTDDGLTIISTSKAFLTDSTNTSSLRGDTDQLWCHLPRDMFLSFTLASIRQFNTVTMEYNCDALLTAFKRYDKIISQGTATQFKISLIPSSQWNQTVTQQDEDQETVNPMHILNITFQEVVYVNNAPMNNATYGDEAQNGSAYSNNGANTKCIVHNFKVPVKLLFKVQDVSIVEPSIENGSLILYDLPPSTGAFGQAFLNFMKRIERYSNVRDIRLHSVSKKNKDEDENEDQNNGQLKIIIDNELHWYLEICWNGPLTFNAVTPNETVDKPQQSSQKKQILPTTAPSSLLTRAQQQASGTDSALDPREKDDMFNIENSEAMISHNSSSAENSMLGDYSNDNSKEHGLQDISRMVEQAERDNNLLNEVIIRAKDWKVCSKLYLACDEAMLLISHDSSCVFQWALQGDTSDEEKGRISYYITRSKALP
ncbi:similar to Saccharomyces cerevisiae YLR288C MEC3 DNA damage and meiotic pachytene checkpoint protein [Maudiozyma saulgeensis]|uniref:Similar to Saccharomyces cerevisiae YLR288C MEC3 DNA damage and meiotic pachytene checkpoint protein n=1 Tax=Maudiozyma saulgeensis TaxID=1789683 RepID=A0A1X7R6N4_9SACH|nr:similar to Saccharomyces cerevisiae YLR288C MEC3 DNA damage and meiotic pachytene checkpoint protein [Kazachstania saulgeensis]